MTIDVVSHGPLYRARAEVTVPYGYPGRSFFMHGVRICVAWGLSGPQAVRRCVRKAQKTERDVAKWREVRRRKTMTYTDDAA